jgi:hypothetical protein
MLMHDDYDELPLTEPDEGVTKPAKQVSAATPRLVAFEQLGTGLCGFVRECLFVLGNREEPCAAKVFEHDFSSFGRELGAYECLNSKPFVPHFYGGFAGMWVTGPVGVLVLQLLEKNFTSYDEMDEEQK